MVRVPGLPSVWVEQGDEEITSLLSFRCISVAQKAHSDGIAAYSLMRI